MVLWFEAHPAGALAEDKEYIVDSRLSIVHLSSQEFRFQGCFVIHEPQPKMQALKIVAKVAFQPPLA